MTPYLTPVTRARFLEAEAGNRAQSDNRCGMTLVLMGSSYGETEPRKATYPQAGHNKKKTPDFAGDKPNSRRTVTQITVRV